MAEAVGMGLVDKINGTRGTSLSKEAFLEDCKDRARLPEVYEQAYNCNPQGSTSGVVPWAQLAHCQRDYTIIRSHLEARHIEEMFGAFDPRLKFARETRIDQFIKATFGKLFQRPGKYRLGFDVAASGEGDLAVLYIDRKEGSALRLEGLFTCRTDDWNFLETVLFTFLRNLPSLRSAGDETGLGRQICWTAAQHFPGIFTPVNFASEKHDLGFALMNQLSVAEKQMPKGEADIAADFFALRKFYSGKRWVFSEGRNLLNPNSHCDIAWAGALASKADTGGGGMGAMVG
jgi:phage FluMu gp28-like protein